MTKAQAKKIAYGWSVDVLRDAIDAGGLEGIMERKALFDPEVEMLATAVREIADSLEKRGLPPEEKSPR